MHCLPLLLLICALVDALFVYVDDANCVHLRCEWRGTGGKYCKPAASLRRAIQLSYKASLSNLP